MVVDNFSKKVQQRYAALCQELGQHVLHKNLLEEKISTLQQKIRALDEEFPVLSEYVRQSVEETNPARGVKSEKPDGN